MGSLAGDERYEEAADLRDRAGAFTDAHRRVRQLRQVHAVRRLVVRIGDLRAVFQRGKLVTTEAAHAPSLLSQHHGDVEDGDGDGASDRSEVAAIDIADADELRIVCAWLDKHAARIEVKHCEGELCSALPRLPDLRPRKAGTRTKPNR